MALSSKETQADYERQEAEMLTIEAIATVAHNVNRAYCQAIGDDTQVPWADAEEWQKQSAFKGVEFCLHNPDAPPSANHDSWLAEKKETGWKYGKVKDAEKKEHPCFVPYEELPTEQKAKDYIFKGVVESLRPMAVY